MHNKKTGTLYVVATPIGNLQDISLRGLTVLKEVDRVIAEDTRHVGHLLKHFAINKPTLSMHKFNEEKRLQTILAFLEAGENLALVSDAGTPLISDPGYSLIAEARKADITIIPIPGACAAITALCAAGLPTERFCFEGFLPASNAGRRQSLQSLKEEQRTLIFYEAPHRLLDMLASLIEIFGPDRQAVVAKELTKVFETIVSQPLGELIEFFKNNPDTIRGEFVVLVAGASERQTAKKEIATDHVLSVLMATLPLKQAVALASEITGERKNELYAQALAKKGKD